MRTNHLAAILMIGSLVFTSGCEFFQGDDDSDFGDDNESGDTGDGDGDDDPPPTQGFRVFPKFMLQDLPAIVTIEIDGVTATACELDGAPEGGYVCDASGLPADALATIRVDKDGFDTAYRNPVVVYYQIVPLEIHMAVEGGPTGSWSACVAAGEFETCADLCASVQGSCAVTSCATEDPQWPIASYQTFADAECTTQIEDLAQACESPLPVAGTIAALRCCCG